MLYLSKHNTTFFHQIQYLSMCSHLKFTYGALNQTMPAQPRPVLPNCHMYKKERTGHATVLLVLIFESYKLFDIMVKC